jgi:hypothetical protein
MVSTITGSKPCQAMRHAFVSTWIKHFYKRCMPRCLIYSDALVTGPWVLVFVLGSRP